MIKAKTSEQIELGSSQGEPCPAALVQIAFRGLLGQLETAMGTSFDAAISGRVIKVAAALLGQLHSGISSFSELKDKAMAAPKQSLCIRASARPPAMTAALPEPSQQKHQANKNFKLDLQYKVTSQCSQRLP